MLLTLWIPATHRVEDLDCICSTEETFLQYPLDIQKPSF